MLTVQAEDRWLERPVNHAAPFVDTVFSDGFPDKDWWQGFHDGNLTDYIQTAFKENPNLQLAELRIQESRSMSRITRAQQLPFVGIEEDTSRRQNSGTGNLFTSQPTVHTPFDSYASPLSVSYELDLFGKNRLKTLSALKDVSYKTYLRQAAALTLASDVAASYFNLLRTDAMVQTARQLVDNLTQAVAIRHLKFESGLIAYDDVLLSEQNLSKSRQALTQYESQRAVFAHQLSILTGKNPKTAELLARTSLDQLKLPSSISTGLPSSLLTRRPDLLAQEALLEQAGLNVKEARRELLPTVMLTGQYGFSSTHFSQWLTGNSSLFNFGNALVQPLFAGGAKRANLKLKKTQALEQIQQYHSVILTAYKEVEDSLASLKQNTALSQASRSDIERSQQSVALNQNRFETGLGNRLDWLDAQRQLITYQQQSIESKTNSLIDLVSLYKALGGGYQP